MSLTRLTLATLLTLLAGHAGAQTIYKCVVDGHVSYGQQPCERGVSTEITVPKPQPVTGQERATYERQKEQLARLETERKTREAAEAEAKQQSSKASAEKRANCESLKLEVKWADENAATPSAAQSDEAQARLLRATQRLASACGGT
jgi:type IV secretory pathway VirB10-like protein